MAALTKLTQERYSKGLTIPELVNGMGRNRELFRDNYDNFLPKEADVQFFAERSRVANVLVLGEEWCGDVIRYVPTVAKLADTVGSWQVRFFYRDQNYDLADNWRKGGLYRAIPVIVFFDEALNELTHFIEKPTLTYNAEADARQAFADEYSAREDVSSPTDQMSAETYDLYAQFMRGFRANSTLRWQQLFVDDIRAKLS